MSAPMPPDDYVADLPVQEPNEIESITTFVSDHPVMTIGGLVLVFVGFMLLRSRAASRAPAAMIGPSWEFNPSYRRRKSRRY